MTALSDLITRLEDEKEGEPDFKELANSAWNEEHGLGTVYFAAMFGERMYHLGLAARPKVEDAEVASYIERLHAEGVAWLTEKDGAAIADLLERLAAQLPEGMQHCTTLFRECEKGHGTLTATNWIQHPCQICRAEAAEAKLAELHEADVQRVKDISRLTIERDKAREALVGREAELAEADSVVAALSFKFDMPDAADTIINDAARRHAARQQQKASAEPTGREEETL